MRIACLIDRRGHYKSLGPVIDEALSRGWPVECWHNYAHPRQGLKGYQFPSMAAAPMFRHGIPTAKRYHGAAELREWLAGHSVDAVVALGTPTTYLDLLPDTPMPRWIGIQHGIDLFYNGGPRGLLSCDVVGLHSAWWMGWAARYFEEVGLLHDRDAFERQMESRVAPIGLLTMDHAPLVDPAEVRRRWGIPPKQPVVVLLPFPGAINPFSFWAPKIYLEPSRLKRVLNVLLWRRVEYLGEAIRRQDDAKVVRAIRRFCDRNGAYLLVKSRLKTPIPAYTQAVADRCLYDESEYPATMVEALSIASLCISFYSVAVLEAAGMGVPHLCITFSARDYYDHEGAERRRFELVYHAAEGGLFQHAGVSTTMTLPEVLKRLPERRLEEFASEPRARAQYIAQYLGHADRRNASRLVDVMERLARDQSLSGAR